MAEGARQETNEHTSQFSGIAGNVTGSFPRCCHFQDRTRRRIRKARIYIIMRSLSEIARNMSNEKKEEKNRKRVYSTLTNTLSSVDAAPRYENVDHLTIQQ